MKNLALGLLVTVVSFGLSQGKDNKAQDNLKIEGCTVRVDIRYKNSCGQTIAWSQNAGTREGTATECAEANGGVYISVVTVTLDDFPCNNGPKIPKSESIY